MRSESVKVQFYHGNQVFTTRNTRIIMLLALIVRLNKAISIKGYLRNFAADFRTFSLNSVYGTHINISLDATVRDSNELHLDQAVNNLPAPVREILEQEAISIPESGFSVDVRSGVAGRINRSKLDRVSEIPDHICIP